MKFQTKFTEGHITHNTKANIAPFKADKPLHPSRSQADESNGLKKTPQRSKKMPSEHTGHLARSLSTFP